MSWESSDHMPLTFMRTFNGHYFGYLQLVLASSHGQWFIVTSSALYQLCLFRFALFKWRFLNCSQFGSAFVVFRRARSRRRAPPEAPSSDSPMPMLCRQRGHRRPQQPEEEPMLPNRRIARQRRGHRLPRLWEVVPMPARCPTRPGARGFRQVTASAFPFENSTTFHRAWPYMTNECSLHPQQKSCKQSHKKNVYISKFHINLFPCNQI